MSKSTAIYTMDKRMLRKIRRKATQCYSCKEQIKLDDPTFSKRASAGRVHYYHYKCALAVKLVTGDFNEVTGKE